MMHFHILMPPHVYCIIRALVDMLRHQSSPVQQDERNNSVALTVGDGQGTLGRAPKNLYAPGLPSKDNRCEGLGLLQH